MGAQKQRWSAEEEAALRAGVIKHGSGKWCTILRDPEFSSVLRLRSNVDLKDKWRNLNVTSGGFGSREKGRMAYKKGLRVSKSESNAIVAYVEQHGVKEDKVIEVEPLTISYNPVEIDGSDKTVARLDDLIVEAVKTLNEPSGSSKAAIAAYIEDQYWSPPDFKRLLSVKLKNLEANGRVLKIHQKYRLTPVSASKLLRSEESHSVTSVLDNGTFKQTTKMEVDAELAMMASMSQQEAADFAARAVAAAEIALAEAEEANRIAEAAEAEAEEAKAFAEAAAMSLRSRSTCTPAMLRA